MRRIFATSFALIGLLVGTALVAWQPTGRTPVAASAAATPVADLSVRSVNVNGVGKATLTPDMATVIFGVESSGADLIAAQTDNATRTQAVIDKLKGLGIAANDLQTTGYNIQPQYDRDQKLTGYRVVNSVRAIVRDIKTLGTTIDEAVKAGANRISGISFDASKKDEATRQAREAAVANAKQKAEQYAQLTGVTLGPVLQIVETSAAIPADTQRTAAPAAASSATPIEPGEGSLTITVQIIYELR